MAAIGTGYDLSNSVFSNDGRMFQVEYAMKAVENGGTAIGIKCKDGVVLALDRPISSPLVKETANKRIVTVDKHIGMVCTGLEPDSIPLIHRAREEARSWKGAFKVPIYTSALANRLADFKQAYTCYSSVRPFGVVTIVAGWDLQEEPRVEGLVGHAPARRAGGSGEPVDKDAGTPYLYMLEPNGNCLGYYGAATGKGQQAAKAELEKLNLHVQDSLTIREAVFQAARIIKSAHGKVQKHDEIEYKTEISWVGRSTGGKHERVPDDLLDEAVAAANKEDLSSDEGESDGEGDKNTADRMED